MNFVARLFVGNVVDSMVKRYGTPLINIEKKYINVVVNLEIKIKLLSVKPQHLQQKKSKIDL